MDTHCFRHPPLDERDSAGNPAHGSSLFSYAAARGHQSRPFEVNLESIGALTTCTCSFRQSRSGERIPCGAWVVGDLESCMMDAENFPNPTVFSPKRYQPFLKTVAGWGQALNLRRFLEPGAMAEAQPAFVAFSVGRRGCVGAQAARVALLVAFARLLQLFHFSFAPNSESRRPISLAPDGTSSCLSLSH